MTTPSSATSSFRRSKRLAWPSTRQPLDSFDFLGIQAEIKDLQVGPHVVDVSGAGQGDHAHVEGEPKDDLADSPSIRQTVILSPLESILGLKEQIALRQQAVLDRGGNGSADCGLIVSVVKPAD